jgi:exodeoxyribonuclease VIII
MNALFAETPSISQMASGIYPDVPAEIYHRRELGVVNNGALKILSGKTPAHYQAWVETTENDDAAALVFGRALHCAVLEPDLFAETYVEPVDHPHRRPTAIQRNAKKPSQSTLDAIAYWDAWEAANAGKTEITLLEKQKLIGMSDAIRRHPLAGRLLVGGTAEETIVWDDPRTGLRCKARADYHAAERGVLVDIKTTEDASEKGFMLSVARYGYHLQHAHYASAFQALGHELRAFLFVAVEKEPPYAVAVHCLDPEAEARGIELRDRAMDTLNHCLRTDTWPAYEPRIHRLALPLWALRD